LDSFVKSDKNWSWSKLYLLGESYEPKKITILNFE
jgi:hypothetical protein